MKLNVRPIASHGRDFNRFVELPYRLHQNLEHWVPPLRPDVKLMFDREKNPFFEHSEVQAFLAERPEGSGSRVVGRIAAIENSAHNDFHDDRVGFFGFFECEEDPEAAAALFDAASDWLGARDLDTMRGPANFSTNDDCGLLIHGFHRPAALMMPYNPPYYEKLVEGVGFAKARDLVAFYLAATEIPERLNRAADLVKRRSKVTTRPLNMKKYSQEIDLVREIYNTAWEKNWGFVPLTEHEVDHLAKQLKPVVDANLIRFAEVDNEPIAFVLALPDMNLVLRHLGGRLGPIELAKLLWYSRKIDMLRVFTLGIKPGFRSSGIDALLYRDIFQYGYARGIFRGEFSWVLEDNLAMCRPLERMGAKMDRTYRLYDRPIQKTPSHVDRGE